MRNRTLTALDRELLELARKYNSQALAEIYDRYAERIYGYLYRLVGDAAQAEDLTSEVFLRLLRALSRSCGPREQLSGWLYRVAHNLAMDWFRQQARASNLSLDEGMVSHDDAPPALVEGFQSSQRLRLALSQLTSTQQQVIVLRFGEGLKVAEVGRILGKSEGAIRILQHRAIRRLKKLLEQEEKQIHEQRRSEKIGRSPAASIAGRGN